MKYVAWWTVCFVVLCGCERDRVERRPAPAAVVFAYDGQEFFVGNETVEPDPHQQYQGALQTMKNAFVSASPAKELPPGSVGMLISYAEKVTVPLPMGPVTNMTPDAFGTQQDYRGHIGQALVGAIQLGVDELSKVPAERRLLIVFGDGTDTDMSTASDRLHALKPRLEREHIKAYLVAYKTDGPEPAANDFYDEAWTVVSADGLASQLHAIWRGASRKR